MMAGSSFQDVKLFGRWRSDAAALGYLEASAGLLMRGLEKSVCLGQEVVRLLDQEAPSREKLRMARIRRQVKKTRLE